MSSYHRLGHPQLLGQGLAPQRLLAIEVVADERADRTRVRRRPEWEKQERQIKCFMRVRLWFTERMNAYRVFLVQSSGSRIIVIPRAFSSAVERLISSRTSSGSTVWRVHASSHFGFCWSGSARLWRWAFFLDLSLLFLPLRRENMPGITVLVRQLSTFAPGSCRRGMDGRH